MNEHRLPFPAADGHVTLAPEDAQALADATAAQRRASGVSPVFRVTDRDNDADIETIAGLLQELVKQNKSGMRPRRWRWATGKQIDDASTLRAISARARFEKLDAATDTWQSCPCPMMYAMQVRSGLYASGGRKS
jgi:hypothetical protein